MIFIINGRYLIFNSRSHPLRNPGRLLWPDSHPRRLQIAADLSIIHQIFYLLSQAVLACLYLRTVCSSRLYTRLIPLKRKICGNLVIAELLLHKYLGHSHDILIDVLEKDQVLAIEQHCGAVSRPFWKLDIACQN